MPASGTQMIRETLRQERGGKVSAQRVKLKWRCLV